jgi:hypothetical protein
MLASRTMKGFAPGQVTGWDASGGKTLREFRTIALALALASVLA